MDDSFQLLLTCRLVWFIAWSTWVESEWRFLSSVVPISLPVLFAHDLAHLEYTLRWMTKHFFVVFVVFLDWVRVRLLHFLTIQPSLYHFDVVNTWVLTNVQSWYNVMRLWRSRWRAGMDGLACRSFVSLATRTFWSKPFWQPTTHTTWLSVVLEKNKSRFVFRMLFLVLARGERGYRLYRVAVRLFSWRRLTRPLLLRWSHRFRLVRELFGADNFHTFVTLNIFWIIAASC